VSGRSCPDCGTHRVEHESWCPRRVLLILERAQGRGHDPVDDSPGGLSTAQRWTCTRCGLAVLRFQGNVYGSLLDADVCLTADERAYLARLALPDDPHNR
jgi:hypothetical protein